MPDEGEQVQEGTEYVESGEGFDHPNAELMNNQILLTVNNERIVNGYIKAADVPIVKSEVRIMGALERLYAGGLTSSFLHHKESGQTRSWPACLR